jgi:hypothetical protein
VAIGQESDLADFEAGTLDGIVAFDNNNAESNRFENLDPDTSYTVFARGVGKDGTNGETSTLAVRTEAKYLDLAIGIEESTVVEEYAKFAFTPGADVANYSVALGKASDLAAFEAGTLTGIVKYTNGKKQSKGFDKLTPNTEYTVFAQGVDSDGNKGEVTTYVITTQKDEYKLLLTIHDINALVVSFTVAPPSTATRYIAMFALADNWEGQMGDSYEDKVKALEEASSGQYNTDPITSSMKLSGYSGEKYICVSITYDENGGKHLSELPFETPAYDSSAPMPGAMKLSLLDVQDKTATFSVLMGENTVGFFESVYKKADYETAFANNKDALIQDIAQNGYSEIADYPQDKWNLSSPGTDYVLVAIPMNKNGLEGIGDVNTLEFTTTGTATTSLSAAASGEYRPCFKVPGYLRNFQLTRFGK